MPWSLRVRRRRIAVESLEARVTPATDVLNFHGGVTSTGVNPAEAELAPTNVNTTAFGKLSGLALDGQVYTQPLVKTGVTVANGPNTTPGAAGVHDLVLVATQHDSVYAIDAAGAGGTVLWRRTFLDVAVPANNTLGATAITAVPSLDTGSTDIDPEVGITGTPVIDGATNTLYVVTKTKETVGGAAHYVQRLHALSLSDGTDRSAPFLLGDTVLPNVNNTPIFVYGAGEGSVTDPYFGTGRQVVQFDALREHQRPALSLVNGAVYISWASHGDTGPYHGWVVALDVSNLAGGITLRGVFNASPNDGDAGVWQSGGQLAFETDGSAFYVETGNGTGGAPTLNAQGFPADGNYNEALVKVVADPTTGPANQNVNGWGMKAADYFIPYNVVALDGADSDFGSGAPVILPDSAGIPGHPHLIVAGGKEGKLYVLDRDHLGHFDPVNDAALNAVPNGSGHNTPPKQVNGLFGTPVWFDDKLYAESGLFGRTFAFSLGSDGHLTAASQTAVASFGALPGSPIVSANGDANGVLWVLDRQTTRLRAYDAATLATQLWDSGQRAGGLDALGTATKFAVPTVANGRVYIGTLDGLVTFGHFLPPQNAPLAPTLSVAALSGSSINLSWTDPTSPRDLPTSYAIEVSLDGTNFATITAAPAGATSLAVGGLQPLTTYHFRVRGVNAVGGSAPSNVAAATTADADPLFDFGTGFANAGGTLSVNSPGAVVGDRLRLTGGASQSGTAFTTQPVDVTGLSTRFTFQLTAAAADGFTFTVQRAGPTVNGVSGGYLGYGGIADSVAVKFDIFNNDGEGYNSTGLYTNGATPTNVGSIDLGPAGIDFHSGHVFRADLAYGAGNLRVTITDTRTGVAATQNYAVNIPAVIGGDSAYVGFTGGTGSLTAVQDILTWTLTPGAAFSPNAPTGLGAVPVTGSSVALTWTSNATTQSGYHLDRATDAGFTQNLVTQILPPGGTAFTDTAAGLAPGGTYYYRLRAFNSAGDSGNSNIAPLTIPLPPPAPTGLAVENVGPSVIDLSWTDHAGHQAAGYRILRSTNDGPFVEVDTLPPTSRTPPSTYEWSDSNLTAGTAYSYRVLAFNSSGNNPVAGTTAITLTNPPTAVNTAGSFGVVNLSWAAPAGAVTFNVYRSTTPGGEGTTPLATEIIGTSFADTAVRLGSTYYYTVTATNANPAPLAAESLPSAEVPGAPTPQPSAPGHPATMVGSNTAAPAVIVSWDPSVAAQSYNVYRSTSSNRQSDTPLATGLTGTTFTDPNATLGTTYFYKVAAVNGAGEGAWSAEVRATPLFAARVHFTTPTGEAVPGYLADTGVAYGDRGGIKYGWTRDDRAQTFDRDAVGSSDELYDSFHDMGTGTVAWHMAVPNGTYDVHVLAGDLLTTTGQYRLNVSDRRTGGVAAVRYTPTVAAPWVETEVHVTVTTGELWVRNAGGGSPNRLAAVEIRQVEPGVDLPGGFAGAKGLSRNGAAVAGTGALRLTGPVRNQARSVFTTTALNVAAFHTTFDFKLTSAQADGFAFVIQGVSPKAKGQAGAGLGYAGIGKSVAVAFDLSDNAGAASDSIGLYTNGAMPTGPGAMNLTSSGIDLHRGNAIHADLTYEGGRLTVVLTDLVTGATATRTFDVDIVGTAGSRAYVGFTGSTGTKTAVQEVLNWTYDARP
jgi:fibronectin type 3 domain-containing protein